MALGPGLRWWCLNMAVLGNVLNLLAPCLPASSWVAPLLHSGMPLAQLRVPAFGDAGNLLASLLRGPLESFFSLGRWVALGPGLRWWRLNVAVLGNVLNLLAPRLPASSSVAPLLHSGMLLTQLCMPAGGRLGICWLLS